MLAHVFSCAVIGLDGVLIDIEVDYGQGLPHMAIVGLPDEAVKESRERVYSAIKNAFLVYPRRPLTVNLAPASVRKEGPFYDLPIAVGVLITGEQIPPEAVDNSLIIGELSLDGSVRHIRGVLAAAALARSEGYKKVYVPAIDAPEASLIPDIEVYPVEDLNQLWQHLNGENLISPFQPGDVIAPDFVMESTDFSEVKGQEHIKRALEVAAAGGHNVLMTGSPGAGKTLLARAMTSILPSMSLDESLEVTRIYSISDQ
ncbi:MAG: magnesium chelatase domain-containing protein, partial [Anaerolineaceae bacterium]